MGLGTGDTDALASVYNSITDMALFHKITMPWKWTVLTVVIACIAYFSFIARAQKPPLSSKAQRSAAMIKAYEAIESKRDSIESPSKKPSSFGMSVSQIYIYPIKSLRGCTVSSATLTREGFSWDRKFMLLQVQSSETPPTLKNMAISKIPSMCLFHTAIQGSTLTITYQKPGASDPNPPTLEIPLQPKDFATLEKLNIDMHYSPTIAYNMGSKYNDWFSQHFGFKVVLAYWGGNPRTVLGNLPPSKSRPQSLLPRAISAMPFVGTWVKPNDDRIAFNDCAPFLCITEESTADVSSRLDEGVEMDITKFRANIVLKGSPKAFDEDFWAELKFGNGAEIFLTANCARCVSLNVDYETGESGTGRAGGVLKLMMKDRRVDEGTRYSPVFGRYGFVSRRSEGRALNVGEEVFVSRTNEERTRFFWPGLST